MKIVITGSSGFIGSNLLNKLKLNKNNEIIEYDILHNRRETLNNFRLLSEKLKDVDIIFHLAGISNSLNPDIYKVNVDGTNNILGIIKNLRQKTKVILASTFGVYKIPKKNDLIDENFDTEPRNVYGKSKLIAEKSVLRSKQNIVFRFSNVYGPMMPPGSHSVVSNFIEAISNNKKIDVWEKKATRDFLYIDDLIECLLKVPYSSVSGVFNICSGEETSILGLIKIIERQLNKKAIIDFCNTNEHSGYWKGNFSKSKKAFDWKPKTKIKKGIENILSNYK